MDRPREPNLLHPMTSIIWREASPPPIERGHLYGSCVATEQEVFVMQWVLDVGSPILVYDIRRDLWEIHSRSPTRSPALTTYHSQLVLIGGREIATHRATNIVFVWQEREWRPSLPPMTLARYRASAISSGSHIIVAGGLVTPTHSTVDSTGHVEVFDGHFWMMAQSLPMACRCMKSALHNRMCCLGGGEEQGSEVFRATVQSIVDSTRQPAQPQVWTRLPPIPHQICGIASFGQQLVAIGGRPDNTMISAYFPQNQSWVHVEDTRSFSSLPPLSSCALALPTGDLMVVTESGAWIGQLKAHPYHPDSWFSISAIERLSSVIGVDMWHKIWIHRSEFITATQLQEQSTSELSDPAAFSKRLLHGWLDGKSPFSPSWMNLLTAMRSSGLRELSHVIEQFLRTVHSTASIPVEGAVE